MMKPTLIDAVLWAFEVGEQRELSSTERIFLQALIQIWNQTGRGETFYAANSVLKRCSGIASHSCILRIKRRLRDQGLIKIESGLGSRASQYSLLFEGMTSGVTQGAEGMTPKVTRMTPKVTRMTPEDIQMSPRVTNKERECIRVNKSESFLEELKRVYPPSRISNIPEIEELAGSIPQDEREDVIQAIDNLTHSDEWRGDQAKFIPGLAKFLREQRWKGSVDLPISELNPEQWYHHRHECYIRLPGWREVVASFKDCNPADLQAGEWREFVDSSGEYMTKEYTDRKKSLAQKIVKDP